MQKNWVRAATALLFYLLWANMFMGTAQGREYVVWMTLPETGDSLGCNYGDPTGPRISQLEALEAWAVSFNPAHPETLRAWIGIVGMEGDTIGVAWQFADTLGFMGEMRYRVRNPIGWSCPVSFVFASPPAPPDTIAPPDTTAQGLTVQYYDNADFTNLYATTNEDQIFGSWGWSPPQPGMDQNLFSVRWTGKLSVPTSGTYRLCDESCTGGYMFYFEDSLLSTFDSSGCGERCVPVNMVTGQRYDVRIEYWHTTTGPASNTVRWLTPSGGDQPIPARAWR